MKPELGSFDLRDDKLREECGLMGVWNLEEAANLTYLGLYAQQHRGQEGAGVISVHKSSSSGVHHFHSHRGLGLVADVFHDFDFTSLPGNRAIGHVRYTTAGGSHLANVQPLFSEISCGRVALAHNGNLINAETLRKELIRDGAIFGTSSDTEVIMHLLARSPKNIPRVESVINALQQIRGAFSLLFLFADRLIAVRDPRGIRPLVLGKLRDSYIVASETCAFDLVGGEYVREIQPGEVLEISEHNTLKSYFPFGHEEPRPCIFEYVYFARPDSQVFARNVYSVRKRLGQELARECNVPGDLVIPVPDSGTTAAIGYSQEAGIPLELGLIRNHYVGRTFIEPKQSIRSFGVKVKLNANPDVLRDKVVIVVDDSIVRGTTSRKLIGMIRKAGAKEVHMRVSAPPTTDPCYYGVDTPKKEKLIASRLSIEEIEAHLGADSLQYLSREGMYRAVGEATGKMCDACFTGNYPAGTVSTHEDKQEELFQIK